MCWGCSLPRGRQGKKERTSTYLPGHFSLVLASPNRLGRPLVKSWRARRGQAHGLAGPRAPCKPPPFSQTTMTWATTCGPTCFKVRLKGRGGECKHAWSLGHWAPEVFGGVWILRAQGTTLQTSTLQTPKASFMLVCPVRIPGSSSPWQVCLHYTGGDREALSHQTPMVF